LHILWKIGLGSFILVVVVFGLAFWSTDRCTGCYTVISFTYHDISNFNQTQIIESVRENLTKEPTMQNKNFAYLESIEFRKSTIKDNIVYMKFPLLFANDSKELIMIVKTLNKIESISEVSEPFVERLSAP
jgi:hypothetical protein